MADCCIFCEKEFTRNEVNRKSVAGYLNPHRTIFHISCFHWKQLEVLEITGKVKTEKQLVAYLMYQNKSFFEKAKTIFLPPPAKLRNILRQCIQSAGGWWN